VWGVYFSFGLVIGATAALVPAIRDDLDLSRGEMGLVLGAWQLVYLGAAVPAGRLLDRIGLRRGLAIAALVIAASGILRAASTGLASLLVTVGLFGIGGPLISIGAPKLVAVWFNDAHRRLAVGIYGMAPPLGMTVALALTNSAVRPALGGSWRAAMVAFSVVGVAAAVLWWAAASRVPERSVGDDGDAEELTSRGLLRLPVVRVVLVLAVGGFLFSHAIANWLVELLEEGGRSVSAAGWWAAVPTFVSIFATLLVPRFAAPDRRKPLLAGVFLLGAAGVAGTLASATLVLAPALVATGISRTSIMPIAMLVLMDSPRVGSRNMAAAGGLFFTAGEIGGVAGPALTGALADASGGFGLPVTVLAVVLVAMAALTFAIPDE
jgi:cyanate permease